jgi:hypothetical protein
MGPAEPYRAKDRVAARLRVIERLKSEGKWEQVVTGYVWALEKMPPGDTGLRNRMTLEMGRARWQSGDLPGAMTDLETALDSANESGDAPLAREARSELAASHYYAAWLMRLEGAELEEWKAEAETARQYYRFMGEDNTLEGTDEIERHRRNLECVVRLERMDISELRGMPLPKNCRSSCNNLSQRRRQQRQSRKRRQGKGKNGPQDIRKELRQEREATVGVSVREEGTGS